MRPLASLAAAAAAMLLGNAPLAAQGEASPALELATLLSAADRRDPRLPQRDLVARQSAVRTRSLDAERLPSLQVMANGQYVSDVPSINGVPMVPYQQYDAYLLVRQRLWDPTRAPRRALENAQADEADARVRATLWQQRQQVSDAFFTVLVLDAERETLRAALTDLEAQRRLIATRLTAGTALPAEAATIDAELLRRRQALDAIVTDRRATLDVLESLTGLTIADAQPLALPDLAAELDATRTGLDTLRARPEFAQFAATRGVLNERARASTRQDLPRLVAFARTGYGRPGINPLARDFQQYWIAGVQFEWTPWTWGTSTRDAEVQLLQRDVLRHDESAFAERLERAVTRDLALTERLTRSLASDDTIITLHAQVLAETERRFREGAATAAELVDRQTDLLTARIARDRHRVQRAEARARILLTLGQEIR